MMKKTVINLKPNSVIPMTEQTLVFQACAYMSAKRQDALLVVNEQGELTGIITDKDVAFRVIANGLDPQLVSIGSVMTLNPASVTTQDNATDALYKMIAGKFRHLPVISEEFFSDINNGAVYSILDITKCLHDQFGKLEAIYSRRMVHAVQGMFDNGGVVLDEVIQDRIEYPDLSSLLTHESLDAPMLSLETSVYDAILEMKRMYVTGVLCMSQGQLVGIFTTKDLVLRVIAARLDPKTTTLDSVCTPHPDVVTPETTILDALKRMYQHKYLHLPIVKNGTVYGMVDVLKLTYHLLEQIENMESTQEGPLWTKFWDEESRVSSTSNGTHPYLGIADDMDTIAPDDSASMIFPALVRTRSIDDDSFVFKFKDEVANKTTRFTCQRSLTSLKVFIQNKIFQTYGVKLDKNQVEVCFIDEDDDFVHISNDRDLEDGVLMAKRLKWKSLCIMIDRKKMNFWHKPVQTQLKLDLDTRLEKHIDLLFPVAVSSAILVAGLYLLSRPFRIN